VNTLLFFCIKLISFGLDFAPVVLLLLGDPSLVFRRELVALDGCREVVRDEGVSLHTKRIAQHGRSTRDFFYFYFFYFSLDKRVGTAPAGHVL